MLKTYVVARSADRERLLEALRDLGVVHLVPIDPARAVAPDDALATIDRLGRAIQVLGQLTPAGEKPGLSAAAAAAETIRIEQRSAERRSRLAALHRQVEHLAVWGEVRLEQFEQLRKAGIEVRVYSLPADAVGEVRAECVQPVGELPGKRCLVAVIHRAGEPEVPDSAEPVELPARDRQSLRAEAAEVDHALRDDAARLKALAHLAGEMAAERAKLQQQVRFTVADRGGMEEGELYAVQGWLPGEKADALAEELARAGVDAGVRTYQPADDEQPPTLIRLPRWARPIQGLMAILGIQPGYHEQDVSIGFMIALPVFAAMLISDGGYGLLFLLPPIILRRKVVAKMGRNVANLMIVIGAVSIVWGVLTSSFFGVNVAGLLGGGPLIAVTLDEGPMRLLMRLSFTIGLIHLVLAHLWRAATLFPHPAFLSKVGWALFLGGMYGVVCFFVLQGPSPMNAPWLYLLIAGGVLVVLFTSPSRNVLKTVGLGLASFPLSALGTFSDIMSYVRLMAVGLAGSVLAASFNDLAQKAGLVLLVPILVFGHLLNFGLCLIALFAHGVRLNVLEFSNNFGLQWSGYPYQPFVAQQPQEN
jgi:V/A-type H+-transporting ATPase subunit I